MALVVPLVVAGGLVTPMLPYSSLVLGVRPLGTGGRLSHPPGKNAAASGSPGGPAGLPSALCHWEGASSASPKCFLYQSGLGSWGLEEVEGRKKLEEAQGGEKDLGSSSLYLYSFASFWQ